ncbi:hypothetical protein TVAG_432580 [Trichomonas vaginalis G3]|uniref:Uncharacterized protein n=1 Tax=Trichomonas vaginalis (strain ATCC PRA-98 / G3) TaxID=412133 RepID=A2DIP9_TRIV3|nr:hypothetical protein TVAGG3_0562660 [Trichomonas vaginalis G3]EAY19662.1 hypothetical protein TVAG_432580 [Trichomonas vaginalis G3]KAI5521318.1 hypothetical protein TVAGG3_0562660 [Trichomonas vaginalis G3]|eukprot:XP_001580648.1 hypothetical protein [Trichomonas vaginalis G3]
MAAFARESPNSLNFPGREPIPQWRVLADKFACPIFGILMAFAFSNTILNARVPYIYVGMFGLVALIFALIGFRTKSPELRYSGYSLAAYFGCTAAFCLALILLF